LAVAAAAKVMPNKEFHGGFWISFVGKIDISEFFFVLGNFNSKFYSWLGYLDYY
jgi:hypothetical protein